MKAISVDSINESNPFIEIDVPDIENNEVLIKVHAIGVNHVDLLWIDQKQNLNSIIPGLEISGEIVKSNSSNLPVGTRVAALLDNSGYAEYVAVDASRVILLPDEVSYEEGATIPESFLTAYQTLFMVGHLKPQQTVLIHAGASGVGTAAIQLAKKLCDATVITTSSERKTAICKNYGADYALDYNKQNFADEVAKITNGKGANLVLDFIGASYFDKNIASLGQNGQLVLIGNLGGNIVSNVDLLSLMSKGITITGTLLSTRPKEYKADLISQFNKVAMPLLKSKQIRLKVGSTFDFDQAAEAVDYMRNKKNVGKIVLKI